MATIGAQQPDRRQLPLEWRRNRGKCRPLIRLVGLRKSIQNGRSVGQTRRRGSSPWGIGGHALRLDSTGRGRLARFKQCRQARDPRRGLFEPLFERRKPRPHKEKALRRFRRKAVFEEKSGRLDLNQRPLRPERSALPS